MDLFSPELFWSSNCHDLISCVFELWHVFFRQSYHTQGPYKNCIELICAHELSSLLASYSSDQDNELLSSFRFSLNCCEKQLPQWRKKHVNSISYRSTTYRGHYFGLPSNHRNRLRVVCVSSSVSEPYFAKLEPRTETCFESWWIRAIEPCCQDNSKIPNSSCYKS